MVRLAAERCANICHLIENHIRLLTRLHTRRGGSQLRKLPLIALLRHVVSAILTNLPMVFRLGWPWIAIFAATTFAARLMEADENLLLISGPMELGSALALMLGFSSIAVNWHRFVLLGEEPSGKNLLRVDSTVWRYLGNTLLVLLMLLIPLIVSIVVFRSFAGLSNEDSFNVYELIHDNGLRPAYVLLPLINVLWVSVLYRMMTKLPSIALARKDYKFSSAWHDTKGNFLNFILLSAAYTFLLVAPANMIAAYLGPMLEPLGSVRIFVSTIADVAYQWINLMVSVAALTSLYGYFAEKRDL